MLITVLLIVILYVQLSKTVSNYRICLVAFVACMYLSITLIDLYYLESVNNMSFHFSDATNYYEMTKDLTFSQVLCIDSTNTFYFVVNWCYNHIYDNVTFIAFLLKINNILVLLLAYILFTKKEKDVSFVDFVLLFSPYMVVTVIRNVRDVYIILFLTIIFLGIGVCRNNRVNAFWTLLAVTLLSFTRSFLLLPLFLIWWYKNSTRFSRQIHYLSIGLSLLVVCLSVNDIIRIMGNQMLSSMLYIGEDIEELRPVLQGDLSYSIFIFLSKRVLIGLVAFVFTPHPINFIANWKALMDVCGNVGIYTGLDNMLISIGSVYNYLLVLPLTLYWFFNHKKMNRYLFVFVIFYIVLYVVSFVGVTDIRIRNTAFYFILLSLIVSENRVKLSLFHYILTIGVFMALYGMSYE